MEVDLEKLRHNDVNTSPEDEIVKNIHNSVDDYSEKSSVKQEVSPLMSDFVAVQDESIEIKKKIQSTAEDDDKMKSDKVES